MKQLFLFILLIASVFYARSQKNPADKPLKNVYGKEALNAFKNEYGSLDLLYYAYDNALNTIQNNGGKSLDIYPKAPSTPVIHFTDLDVKIEPFTQYFQSEIPNQLIAVKSFYQLQLEFNASKNSTH
jgi:hypothetical protein